MQEKKIICTVCPIGCTIAAKGEGGRILSIEGHTCKRGEEYATNEFLHPVRILTSTVRLKGSDVPLMPVRSNKPLPKESLFDCMEEIKKTEAKVPVRCMDVIIKDILGTGIDIVATGNAE